MAGLKTDVKFRPLKTINYPGAAGQTRDSLPVTEVYQSLNLRLTALITPTVGLLPTYENILSLIRNITIEGVSNNRRAAYGRFKNADLAALYTLQRFLRNVSGAIAPLGTIATGVWVGPGVAATAVAVDVLLDFEFPHSSDPRRTYLNAAKDLQTLSVIVDWGDLGDLLTDALEAGTVTLCQLQISGRELTDPSAKSYQYGINTFSYQEKAVVAAANNFEFDLKRGNLLRGILIKQYTQLPPATFHTPVDTIINGTRFLLNRETKLEFNDWGTLQGQNLLDYHMNSLPYPIGLPGPIPVGYAFIDFMEDGNYNKLVPTQAFTDVILSFDVNAIANGRIRVYPVEIYPAITG